MNCITTLAEADFAVAGTAVLNGYGEIFQKNDDGKWYGTAMEDPIDHTLLFYGVVPRPVVWTPGERGISYH